MTWYPYDERIALNVDGDLVQTGAHSVYAYADTGFATPLSLRDAVDETVSTVSVSSMGVASFFKSEEWRVWLKSGALPAVFAYSPEGMRDAAIAAQVAAEAAQLAAETAGGSFVPAWFTAAGWSRPTVTSGQFVLFGSWRIMAGDTLTVADLIAAEEPPWLDGDAWDPHPSSAFYATLG
jgi:hypothetical protein